MQAVILAGGLGTRLRGIVDDVPKPMAQFNGRPLLDYLVEQLSRHFNEIIMLVGYKKDVIKNYFGNRKWGVKISYSEEEEPLGTGGAIKNAEHLIHGDFLLMNGDNYHELPYGKLVSEFRKERVNTMVITKTQNPTQVTIVKTDKKGFITSLKERPQNPGPEDRFMNAGIYLLKKEVLDLIPEGKVSFEKEIFPLLMKNGMKAARYDGFYIDIGTPDNFNKFKKKISEL